MRTVYEAENIIDAMLVKHALEDAEIPAYVAGAHLSGAIGELPMAGLIRVQVPDGAGIEAEQIVAALRLGQAEGDASEADVGLEEPATLKWAF